MPKLDWRELAAIFAGGFLGALARVLLLQFAPATPGAWPWATFVANVNGWHVLRSPRREWRLALLHGPGSLPGCSRRC
jgi:fluoride ion exporter CrcB/FEX